MPQLDPLIIYTVKLAMDYQTVNDSSSVAHNQAATTLSHQDSDPLFPETVARIMKIKAFTLKPGEKAPILRRENILSLLYHADEQWVNSTLELESSISQNTESHQDAIENVHRQQRIYLNTCQILHKHLMETPKKFTEPIWFAAQVLHNQCQVRHLEPFTNELKPFATELWVAMEQLRKVIRRLVQKQHQHTNTGFMGLFFSSSAVSFYSSQDNHRILESLVPYLTAFEQSWTAFESHLYDGYVQTVFGRQDGDLLARNTLRDIPHFSEDFDDSLKQILPLALDRAIDRQLIDVSSIQSFDPIAFVALPRLAILAGVTWLSHVTGWRTHSRSLPTWIRMHREVLRRIASAFAKLEADLLKTPSQDKHHDFVQIYKMLETALVHGCNDELIKPIYLDICIIADSILTSHLACPFSLLLSHLFRHVGLQYEIEFEDEDDAVPIELTLLDLAV